MCNISDIPEVIDNIPLEVKKQWENDFNKFKIEVSIVFIAIVSFGFTIAIAVGKIYNT
jgi:hypothetical protein